MDRRGLLGAFAYAGIGFAGGGITAYATNVVLRPDEEKAKQLRAIVPTLTDVEVGSLIERERNSLAFTVATVTGAAALVHKL